MTDMIYVGIDVSSRSNSICALDPTGSKLTAFTVQNDLNGSKELVSKVKRVLAGADFHSVSFGFEATSVYGENLMYHLKQQQDLSEYSIKIFRLNPKQVNGFKKLKLDIPKTDHMDAWLIADYLRFGRTGCSEAYMDEKYLALQKLTRARFHTVNNLTREKNRYINNLFLKFSVMTQEKLFSNNLGHTAISLVEDFETLDEIAYMPVEELAEYLNGKSKGKFADPMELAATIQKAARSSYRLPKTVEGSVNQTLSICLIAIKAYHEQIKLFDEAIGEMMTGISNPLTSIKGVGPVYSAGIIAEIGDIYRFKDQASLAKYAGLAWTRYQSGSFEASNTRAIQSGNKYLKYNLMEATNIIRQHDPEFARFYDIKYREVQKSPHKRALALTARKFVRLVYALLRDNKLYTPPRLG